MIEDPYKNKLRLADSGTYHTWIHVNSKGSQTEESIRLGLSELMNLREKLDSRISEIQKRIK